MSSLKYVFFVVGFLTLLYTNLHYANRNNGNPDKSAPYDALEKKLRIVGYGSFALAIVMVVIFN